MSLRTRADRCPGALRPWAASDGLLVRLRLIGGQVSSRSLLALLGVAEEYGDGRIHLTGRANLQVRALPGIAGALRPEVLTALEATGLLPTRTHELVRNVMVSPGAGLLPIGRELDRLLCASPELGLLPGRFLFVLDGRGDLLDRSCDLGLVRLSAEEAQLRVGHTWGPVIPLGRAAGALAGLAAEFVERRGTGPAAPWHVAELPVPLVPAHPADPRLPAPHAPMRYGPGAGGHHVEVVDGLLDRASVVPLTDAAPDLIITPWRGVLVPEEKS